MYRWVLNEHRIGAINPKKGYCTPNCTLFKSNDHNISNKAKCSIPDRQIPNAKGKGNQPKKIS